MAELLHCNDVLQRHVYKSKHCAACRVPDRRKSHCKWCKLPAFCSRVRLFELCRLIELTVDVQACRKRGWNDAQLDRCCRLLRDGNVRVLFTLKSYQTCPEQLSFQCSFSRPAYDGGAQ